MKKNEKLIKECAFTKTKKTYAVNEIVKEVNKQIETFSKEEIVDVLKLLRKRISGAVIRKMEDEINLEKYDCRLSPDNLEYKMQQWKFWLSCGEEERVKNSIYWVFDGAETNQNITDLLDEGKDVDFVMNEIFNALMYMREIEKEVAC